MSRKQVQGDGGLPLRRQGGGQHTGQDGKQLALWATAARSLQFSGTPGRSEVLGGGRTTGDRHLSQRPDCSLCSARPSSADEAGRAHPSHL